MNTTNTTFLSVFFTWFMAVAFLMTTFFPVNSYAQDEAPTSTKPKPKLVKIEINQETNDEKAMEIARKLDPAFFLDEDYLKKQSKTFYFAADFLPLDPNNPEKFLIVTAGGSHLACTGHGCPFYIYQKVKDNNWSLALSLQATDLYYDRAPTGRKYRNLVTSDPRDKVNPVKVWMWNGQYYQEVRKVRK